MLFKTKRRWPFPSRPSPRVFANVGSTRPNTREKLYHCPRWPPVCGESERRRRVPLFLCASRRYCDRRWPRCEADRETRHATNLFRTRRVLRCDAFASRAPPGGRLDLHRRSFLFRCLRRPCPAPCTGSHFAGRTERRRKKHKKTKYVEPATENLGENRTKDATKMVSLSSSLAQDDGTGGEEKIMTELFFPFLGSAAGTTWLPRKKSVR